MNDNILSLQAYCNPPKLLYRKNKVKLRIPVLQSVMYRAGYSRLIRGQFQECKQEGSIGEGHSIELRLLSILRTQNYPSFLNLSQSHEKVIETSGSYAE